MPHKYTTPDDLSYKTCANCHRKFPATTKYFHSLSQSKDGLCPYCKECKKLKNHETYMRHQKERKEKVSAYRKNNPEKVKKSKAKYRKKKENKINRNTSERRNYWNSKREEILAYQRKYYAKHERAKTSRRIRFQRRRAHEARAKGNHTIDDILKQKEKQNNLCYWCHKELEDYHVDHICPLSKGGANGAENIVITCPTCNLRKGDKLFCEWMQYRKEIIKNETSGSS